jgi:hypothetical protein
MEYSYTPLQAHTLSSSESDLPTPPALETHSHSRSQRKRDPSAFDLLADTLPSVDSTLPPTPSDPNASSRIHKIRIVEKFLTHNSLQPSSFPSPLPSTPHLLLSVQSSNESTAPDDDWLDDNSLSLLSSSDLEKLMDRYLFNVVNQLVQLAISDDDLKAELDHLDSRSVTVLLTLALALTRSPTLVAATLCFTTAVSSISPHSWRSC